MSLVVFVQKEKQRVQSALDLLTAQQKELQNDLGVLDGWERELTAPPVVQPPAFGPFTHSLTYQTEILRYLIHNGGVATCAEVTDGIGEQLEDQFTPADLGYRWGEPVWRNHVRWNRKQLIKKGLLSGSRYNEWRLTAAGTARANAMGL